MVFGQGVVHINMKEKVSGEKKKKKSLRPIADYVSKRRFSSCVSAALQDSAVPPSVRFFCRSAARSNLCRHESETCDAWNRADPSFDT